MGNVSREPLGTVGESISLSIEGKTYDGLHIEAQGIARRTLRTHDDDLCSLECFHPKGIQLNIEGKTKRMMKCIRNARDNTEIC